VKKKKVVKRCAPRAKKIPRKYFQVFEVITECPFLNAACVAHALDSDSDGYKHKVTERFE